MDTGVRATLRTENAPSDVHNVRPPALLSVTLDDDEDVEWQWTHFTDGRSAVTGYRIVHRTKLLTESLARRFR